MKPSSRRKRFLYVTSFTLLFFIFAPFIVFYSLGYDIGKNLLPIKTGGIYVFSNENGTKVSLNGEHNDTTTIFQHGILIKSLAPENYVIDVSKDGYVSWQKNVKVVEEKVSEGYPFLIPVTPTITDIPQKIAKGSASGTPLSLNAEFENLSLLFVPKKINKPLVATSTSATSTPSIISSRKLEVVKNKDSLDAHWKGDVNDTPFYFCSPGEILSCKKNFKIYESKNIGTFDFYPNRNDVLFVADSNKIYVVELDMRTPQNIVLLYESKNKESIDFRIVDNENIVVKDGKELKKVKLIYEK